MKKQSLVLMSLVAMTTSAMAMTTPTLGGMYVEGDVGFSKLSAKQGNQEATGNNPSLTLAVGKQVGQVRYEVDYSYFGNAEQKTFGTKTITANQIPFVPAGQYPLESTTDIDAHSVGVSAYYDLTTNGKLTPYVGARVGINHLSREVSEELHQGFADYDISEQTTNKTGVGAGLNIGATYQILPKVSVNAGAQYHYLGKIDDTKVNQYGAKVGVRYQF